MNRILSLTACLLTLTTIHARAQFVDSGAVFTGLTSGDVAWGDFDSDGDLDFVAVGSTGAGSVTEVYRNDGVLWTLHSSLPAGNAAAWGDFDGDHDLDLVVLGSGGTAVYRNDAGSFVDILAGLPEFAGGAVDWGDVDGDGTLDLVLAGQRTSGLKQTFAYRNTGTGFEFFRTYEGVVNGDVEFGDLNGDGKLDLAVAGESSSGAFAAVYVNGSPSVIGLPGITAGQIAWGDYDNDHDQDLVIAGTGTTMQFYENNAGTLIAAAMSSGWQNASLAWGDYDNDGDRDVVQTGIIPFFLAPIAQVFRNTGTSAFTVASEGLPQVSGAHAAWGDVDGDSDLDVLIAGNTLASGNVLAIYENTTAAPSAAPLTPTNLRHTFFDDVLRFEWDGSSDAETPAGGLTYNVSVGSAPGLSDIVPPMARLSDGRRLIPRDGNARHRTFFDIDRMLLDAGEVYWTVQAVDGSFQGSAFAAEQMISIPFTPIANLVGLYNGSCEYGDFNGDGDLDVLVSGTYFDFPGEPEVSGVIINKNILAANDTTTFLQLVGGEAKWTDFDNDGDLDYFASGLTTGSTPDTWSFEYQGGTNHAGTSLGFGGGVDVAMDWGDFDNDGDLDMALAPDGLYENQGGVLVPYPSAVVALTLGDIAFVDYDNDGDLDVATVGKDTFDIERLHIYRNDAGAFTKLVIATPGYARASFDWGDYDSDGDMDVIVMGRQAQQSVLTTVLINNAGTFTVLNEPITGISSGDIRWGDFDNDGDLDFAMVGCDFLIDQRFARIYRNDGNTDFVDIDASLPLVDDGALAWGDHDNDGDLDLAYLGLKISGTEAHHKIWRNNVDVPNTLPATPDGLTTTAFGPDLVFAWNPASDAETPAAGITYNLRVGTKPGGNDVVPSMSLPSGKRMLAKWGNAGHRTTWTLDISDVLGTTLYWSVQAVDGVWAGSPFATEMTTDVVTGISSGPTLPSAALRVSAAAPNPFRQRTALSISTQSPVTLQVDVFNVLGQRVRAFAAQGVEAGTHRIEWDGRGSAGARVASGVYMIRVRSGLATQTRRVVIVR